MKTKLYVFVNSWLSGIQKGIQTSHLIHTFWSMDRDCVFGKVEVNHNQKYFLNNWLHNSHTMILLEGGSHKSLKEKYNFMISSEDPNYFKPLSHIFPVASYSEDSDSLNGCMTAVGIILPEMEYIRKNYPTTVYEYGRQQWVEQYTRQGQFLVDLLEDKEKYKLAN